MGKIDRNKRRKSHKYRLIPPPQTSCQLTIKLKIFYYHGQGNQFYYVQKKHSKKDIEEALNHERIRIHFKIQPSRHLARP
jgi:hypothetical protein